MLRMLLLSYSPYAYWNADSRSYFGFTNGVLTDCYFSLNEKRRYLYPLFLLPVSLLPGGTLQWLSWIQVSLGLVTLLPLAYAVRRIFYRWRWYIIPLTVIYAGMPIIIWYEHELLADAIFFDCFVWMLAGWVAWTSQKNVARARTLWWCFFLPFAAFVLIKPSARFFWPGIVLAFVLTMSWRTLKMRHYAAMVALFLAGLTVGDPDQGAWLLYTTSFPLTRLDTPLHADYKAEIRDWVEEKRSRIAFYNDEDMDVHNFLRSAENHPERPLWQALAKDKKLQRKIYRDLALEGISARPDLFLYITLIRLAGSCNPGDFDVGHFKVDYVERKFRDQYSNDRNAPSMIRIAFGIPRSEPIPEFSKFHGWINPQPKSKAAVWMYNYAAAYERAGELLKVPKAEVSQSYRPTLLGWWLLLGAGASLFPAFLRTIGVWTIAVSGNLLLVYMVGIEHVRYFAPVWPALVLLLAVAPDLLARSFAANRGRRNQLSSLQSPQEMHPGGE